MNPVIPIFFDTTDPIRMLDLGEIAARARAHGYAAVSVRKTNGGRQLVFGADGREIGRLDVIDGQVSLNQVRSLFGDLP